MISAAGVYKLKEVFIVVSVFYSDPVTPDPRFFEPEFSE